MGFFDKFKNNKINIDNIDADINDVFPEGKKLEVTKDVTKKSIYDQLGILSPDEISEVYSIVESLSRNGKKYLEDKISGINSMMAVINSLKDMDADSSEIKNMDISFQDFEELEENLTKLEDYREKIKETFDIKIKIYSSIKDKLQKFGGIVELKEIE